MAFLSDREGGDGNAPQLYVIPTTGGEARRLTDLEKGAGPAVWSPDGTQIAFAARWLEEQPPKGKDERARWDQRPKVVTRAQYKTDGQGYTLDASSRLFIVNVSSNGHNHSDSDLQPLLDSDGEDRAPAWSPNGTQIAFTRTRTDVDDYSLSDLWVVESTRTRDAKGTNARRLTEKVGRAAAPSWSPDGATIAVFGTDEQGPGFGEHLIRVWLVPAGESSGPGAPGGDRATPRCLTADYDRGAFLAAPPAVAPGPLWSMDGSSLSYVAAVDGCLHVVRASLAGATVQPIVTGERWMMNVSAPAEAGLLAFVANSPSEPGDVYVCRLDGSQERRLTEVNRDWLSSIALPPVERRRFTSPHGGEIDGWLFRPQGANGPAPLLLQIHGGPHSYAGSKFEATAFYAYVLAARGWAVLALNPTGSGSYGKAFAHGIRGRWGEHDLPEQIAAVDALIAEGLADPVRLAVAGYSYGGYMASWTIGHSDRIKAAVVGAPVTNFESFHGNSDIGLWFSPWELRGSIFDARETYRRLSPVQHVAACTTPTLILHGEADDRCPIGQGEELYAALVASGKAPVAFVRYPGGAHGFVSSGRPSHRVDYSRRVVEWMERYVRPAAT